MNQTDAAIIFKDVWKQFHDTPVLKGLSLSIPKEATTVILGRSGAGKSVTLKLILGTEIEDRGTIFIDGLNVSKMGSKERTRFSSKQTGMLFQSSALFDSMTISENVGFSIQNDPKGGSLPPNALNELVDEALQSVGLHGFQKSYPSELSGGQKRRAALARLLVYKPKILLFDEPTTGLDPVTAMQINHLIVETQKKLGATCVVVTHDITSAICIGDYFALHSEGTISSFGKKEAFFEMNDPTLRVFIDSAMVPKNERYILESVSIL